MSANVQPTYNPRRRQRRALASIGALVEKRPRAGHNVSHAQNRTKRVFKPNLQKTKVLVDGKLVSVRVDARTIRSLTKVLKERQTAQSKPKATQPQPKVTPKKPTAAKKPSGKKATTTKK